MKKIDFSKIVVKDIEGNPYRVQQGKEIVEYDFCKPLGNTLFYTSKDIRLSEIGQKIYHHETVELTDEEIKAVREVINSAFVAFVLMSVNPQLDELLNEV